MRVGLAAAVLASTLAAQTPQKPRAGAVPEAVQKALDNAGCHRPQVNQDKTVTRGHFVRPSQDDWAALCVSGQSSFIYVVWGGTAQCASTLANRHGTDRSLATRGPDAGRGIDHDGIDDAQTGSAPTTHYCLNRSWTSLK